jgi:DNA polymerase III gamma/tau subunit
MHAFLLINSDPTEFAKKENSKIVPFTLQKVEDARELKKIVKFKFNEKTAILIDNIDKATTEASNAFLKNLEEPTENIIYILTAENINNVLPTIVSRCQIVKVKNEKINVGDSKLNYKDALNIKDREEAAKFIENLIYTDYSNGELKNMETYLKTLQNLKANGNVSLQLANFVVRMNGHGR